MKKQIFLLLTGTALLLTGLPTVHASENEGYGSWLFSLSRKKEIEPVTDKVYNEECGSCHMPYQPGLLPEASWQKLLTAKALENHFGENAELENKTRQHVLDIAVKNSADKSYRKRSKKIMRSLDDNAAPLRITEVPYIMNKHEDVIADYIKTKKVKSLSFCSECHMRAKQGIYDDDTVRIPGEK
ncbi:MAG: diheme cytochrome c [Gammaproteobacteria bacterium]|nr:diheme cytochrome c [Gammaproteobacteria bacterium]MDH5650607.1 diheme cytochrome c [Gammaproteobacteria bacterium]